jgi:hypothetical protein
VFQLVRICQRSRISPSIKGCLSRNSTLGVSDLGLGCCSGSLRSGAPPGALEGA